MAGLRKANVPTVPFMHYQQPDESVADGWVLGSVKWIDGDLGPGSDSTDYTAITLDGRYFKSAYASGEPRERVPVLLELLGRESRHQSGRDVGIAAMVALLSGRERRTWYGIDFRMGRIPWNHAW